MQIESLRLKSYRIWKVDEESGSVARKRLECLEWFDEMRAEGCLAATSSSPALLDGGGEGVGVEG